MLKIKVKPHNLLHKKTANPAVLKRLLIASMPTRSCPLIVQFLENSSVKWKSVTCAIL